MATVVERVQAGATALDAVRPGWAGEINIDQLDISSNANCIVGQLERHGFPLAALVPAEQRYYPMNAVARFGLQPTSWDEGPALTAEWKKQIQLRRERVAEESVA
jgi:hypothetical protein